MAGLLFQVMSLSLQPQPLTEDRRPPLSEPEPVEPATVRASRAPRTRLSPTPLTRTRRNACCAGLASICRSLLVPKFFPGLLASTQASASMRPTGAASARAGEKKSAARNTATTPAGGRYHPLAQILCSGACRDTLVLLVGHRPLLQSYRRAGEQPVCRDAARRSGGDHAASRPRRERRQMGVPPSVSMATERFDPAHRRAVRMAHAWEDADLRDAGRDPGTMQAQPIVRCCGAGANGCATPAGPA
jgi:hypothetical protein